MPKGGTKHMLKMLRGELEHVHPTTPPNPAAPPSTPRNVGTMGTGCKGKGDFFHK